MKSSTLKLSPLVTFRVTAQEIGQTKFPADYFNVFVWNTLEDLRTATGLPGIAGLFRSYSVFNFDRGTDAEVLQPFFGELHLYRDGFGCGIISHECTHAALDWAARNSIQPFRKNDSALSEVSDDEERFCWMQGSFVFQVLNNYEEHLANPRKRKIRMIRV